MKKYEFYEKCMYRKGNVDAFKRDMSTEDTLHVEYFAALS